MPETEVLEAFDAPTSGRIVHETDEVTGVCPFYEGVQDHYHVRVEYLPDGRCVELKSLKHYFESFTGEEISHEGVAERVYADLADLLDPAEIEMTVRPNVRGGISTEVTRHGGHD